MNPTSREQLIAQLRDDNAAGVRRYSLTKISLLWSVAAWLLVVAATMWVGPLRPGWLDQLLTNPHFALETLSGLLAIALFSVLSFRMAVPASSRRWLLLAGLVSAAVWLTSLIVGLWYPALETSMAGKREFCRYETLVYAVGPFLLGMAYLHRGYVINWPASALLIGTLSAMIPAWLMQLACMHDPAHSLPNHLGPIIIVAAVATVIGLLLEKQKR